MLGTKKSRSTTMKPPAQSQTSPASSSVFEGVYNNARMLHFLTAVVGSTCDVRVKSGGLYQGIFKTLSSQCELAVDAVHRRADGGPWGRGGGGALREGGGGPEGGGGGALREGGAAPPPRIEDITDTVIFSPADLVTMTCRDVDLGFAVRDGFTDGAIGSARLNGEHREKVLQRWDADGDAADGFDLEADAANGWDASEMFKFNEETYGVKSTYDSSLSSYTVPLERGSSDLFRQREARAARLAGEIEGGLQYRRRISLENEEGRSEEERFSSVLREDKPREGKHAPPRPREAVGGRGGASGRTAAASRHPASDRTASSPGSQSQSSPPAASSPPCTNHSMAHSLSHPQALADPPQSAFNGVSSRLSPKSQRLQSSRLRTPNSQSAAGPRPQKSEAPPPEAGPAHLDPGTKPSGATPLFNVDVNEILVSAAKERTEPPVEGRSPKAPTVQQRAQLEELRKFGKEFRVTHRDPRQPPAQGSALQLQPSASPTASSPSSDPPPEPGAPKPASSVRDQTPEAAPEAPPTQAPPTQAPPTGPEGACPERGEPPESPNTAAVQVRNSTLNPNAKEFQPVKANATPRPAAGPAPPPPRPTPPSPSVVLPSPGQPGGGGAIYSSPPAHYLSYMSPIHIQPPQVYQYAMSTVSQGKYPRPKGPVVGQRSDHHAPSGSAMMAAGATATGPPLVASPFAQSYLQYGQVIQAMQPHYGQPVYSMLQGGARMLTSAPHHQPMGGPQYPAQAEGPPGPQQALYAAQSFSHHGGPMHHPQPPSTPTGNQPPPQHTAPSPGHAQASQGGPPPSLFHPGLQAPPPSLPGGHTPPQASFSLQGYGLTAPPAAPRLRLAQPARPDSGRRVWSSPLGGPRPPPPSCCTTPPPQQGGASNPQHGPPPPAGGAPALLHRTNSSCAGSGAPLPAALLPPVCQLTPPPPPPHSRGAAPPPPPPRAEIRDFYM
ncbi:LOW QUALITY PROTEIN: ataxin-2-like protein [Menidia menidia]